MTTRTMPLYGLQIFAVAARHLSFTLAARELCLTQGAVSKQIAQLEAQLGYPLFRREVRKLSLSAQGEALLPYVGRALGTLEKGLAAAREARNRLRLKAPSCASRWLLRQLQAFSQVHPDIEVELTSLHDHGIDFGKEPFDLAITYGAHIPPGGRLLFEEQLTPVCSPALLRRSGKPLACAADLAGFTLLHPTRDRQDWQQWLHAANADTVNPAAGQLFDTLDQAMNAALQGFGISLGDVTLLEEELAEGALLAPMGPVLATGKRYALVVPGEGKVMDAVGVFAHWLEGSKPSTEPRFIRTSTQSL